MQIDIQAHIPISDDETELHWVEVEYDIIRRQPDCGIMSDYPEITGITLPNELDSNKFAQDWADNAEDWLEEQIIKEGM